MKKIILLLGIFLCSFLMSAMAAELVFEKTIDAIPAPYPIAAAPDGSLYFGTFNEAESRLYYIADPVNADDVITTIALFSSFPSQRGIQGVAVDSTKNVYVTGDLGSTGNAIFKKYGPPPSFTEDSGFAPSDISRCLGCGLFNDGNLGVCTLNSVRVYSTVDGTRIGGNLYNPPSGFPYHRDMAVNPLNEDVFITLNGNSSIASVLYWSGGTAPDDLAEYSFTEGFVDNISINSTWGWGGQGVGFYGDKNWLLVNNRGTVDGEGFDGSIDVYQIVGSGAGAVKTLVDSLDGSETGVPCGDALDAAGYNYGGTDRIFITDLSNSRILVYSYEQPTSADSSWQLYE